VAVELPFTSTCVDFKYIIAIRNLISPHVTFQVPMILKRPVTVRDSEFT